MSNFGNFVFPLIRGVVLARLLSPTDFGLAISITVVSSIVELVTDVGINQFAVRVDNRDDVPTLHSIALVRGSLLGVGIALSGPLLEHLFRSPGTAWIYSLVGLASLIRSFSHLDVKVAMRTYNFLPEAITDLSTHLVWTLVSLGYAFVFRDYRAMVVGLLAYSATYVIVTHLLARYRWRLGWDRLVVRRSTQFGRPLLPNGAALALVNMGDRTIIGSYLGLVDLATYSVLSTSAYTPRTTACRFLNSLITPQFVNARTKPIENRLLVLWALILTGLGSCFAFGYMALGEPVITLVFGRAYSVSQPTISLVAVLSCVRFIANLPIAPSIAKENTKMILLNTTTASVGLLFGTILVYVMHSINALIAGMCLGECFALAYTYRKLLFHHKEIAHIIWFMVTETIVLVAGCASILDLATSGQIVMRSAVCLSFGLVEVACLLLNTLGLRLKIADFAGVLFPVRAVHDTGVMSEARS